MLWHGAKDMGFDLKSATGQEFNYTGTGWTFYLNLAMQYGWEKKGTRKPKGYGLLRKWAGNYDSNEGQIVEADDATNLANALERALADPILSKQASKLAKGLTAAIEQAIGRPMGYKIDEQVDFESTKRFIAFCRAGQFIIT